jgi:hypothetical protein
MKIADSVWLNLYMRDNEKVQHPSRPQAPVWVVLSSQHLIVLASMIPKDQKNITTLNWTNTALDTCCCEVKKSGIKPLTCCLPSYHCTPRPTDVICAVWSRSALFDIHPVHILRVSLNVVQIERWTSPLKVYFIMVWANKWLVLYTHFQLSLDITKDMVNQSN